MRGKKRKIGSGDEQGNEGERVDCAEPGYDSSD